MPAFDPAAPTTISSAANPLVKKIRALIEQKKARDDSGLFIVEGLRYVSEALHENWLPEIVLATPKLRQDAALRRLLAPHRPERAEVTSELLSRICGRDNADDLLIAFRQQVHPPSAVQKGLWVGLEEIRDPGNLGTIMRTAEAAGASGILLIGNCCDVWSPDTLRASVGAFSRMPIVKASQAEFLSFTKSYKGQVIGTRMQASVDYKEASYKHPLILLMGSEHAGLSPAIMASCTASVRIPMQGKIESLNVATATALLLFEAARHN